MKGDNGDVNMVIEANMRLTTIIGTQAPTSTLFHQGDSLLLTLHIPCCANGLFQSWSGVCSMARIEYSLSTRYPSPTNFDLSNYGKQRIWLNHAIQQGVVRLAHR